MAGRILWNEWVELDIPLDT